MTNLEKFIDKLNQNNEEFKMVRMFVPNVNKEVDFVMPLYLESKKILNVSDNDLYKMITTDFEFDFFGDRVKVITDYEKVDKDKKIVQLVKLVEPKKSFGVHCKWDIVNHLKNN